MAKALTILVASLICWFVVTITIAHWWAAVARSESPVGTAEFFLREMLTNMPNYIYFLVIGSIFAVVLDKKASVRWALLTAAIAMCIYAFISHHIFLQGISYLEIGILLNLYAVPLAFAVGGALTVRSIRDRKKKMEILKPDPALKFAPSGRWALSPRHLAAAQYTMIAVFFVASWYLLLSPIEQARDQLDSMFSPGAENRKFFIWFVIANLLTVIVAVTFWFKRAATYPLAPLLVCLSVALLAWALWWSDATFILIYALGCVFSIWSWRRRNLPC